MNDGGDEHFHEATADGAKEHRDEDAEVGVAGEEVWEEGEEEETEEGAELADDHGDAVADLEDEGGSDEVGEDLGKEVCGDDKGQLGEANAEFVSKLDEEERGKEVDDGLDDISGVASDAGVTGVEVHGVGWGEGEPRKKRET